MFYAALFWTIAIVSALGTVITLGAIAIGAIKPEGELPKIEPRAHWTKGTSHPTKN